MPPVYRARQRQDCERLGARHPLAILPGREAPALGKGLRPRRRPVFGSVRLESGAPFASRSPSAADAQTLNESLVSVLILLLDVVQKRSPLRHHFEKAATGMVVLDVSFEVAGQVGDALGENRNLNFGRPSVADLRAILINERRLALGCDRHRDVLKSAAGRSEPHRFQSGRAGMSSRSVATQVPCKKSSADRALIQI